MGILYGFEWEGIKGVPVMRCLVRTAKIFVGGSLFYPTHTLVIPPFILFPSSCPRFPSHSKKQTPLHHNHLRPQTQPQTRIHHQPHWNPLSCTIKKNEVMVFTTKIILVEMISPVTQNYPKKLGTNFWQKNN